MKNIVMSLIAAFAITSVGAFANEPTAAAPATAPAEAQKVAKLSKKDAHKECKHEGKKGADLKKCVEEKTK